MGGQLDVRRVWADDAGERTEGPKAYRTVASQRVLSVQGSVQGLRSLLGAFAYEAYWRYLSLAPSARFS